LLTKIDNCINVVDNMGLTPLHLTCQNGINSDNAISFVLQMQGVLVNKTDNNGRTGLHYACINGLNSVVHLLLNFPGIQVDIPDINGDTPLHLAILGFESTLLYYGRKVNIIEAILHNRLPLLMTRNSNGDTPYQIALRKKEKLDNYSLVRKKRIGVIEKLEHWTHVVRVLEDATKRLRMQMFLYFLEYN
jgi:hypothetical protein